MSNKTEENELRSMVAKAADDLGEHFDSVHIFCTRHSCDGTRNTKAIDEGRGNFYAQLGQVSEWLCIMNQYQRNWAINKDEEE